MKCLRALSKPMLAELAEGQDFSYARTGELVSIPKTFCPDSGSQSCHCHRVFVGLTTGNPATLAIVCEDEPEFLADEIDSFESITEDTILITSEDIPLHGLSSLAATLHNVEVGTIIRVHREDGVLSVSAW